MEANKFFGYEREIACYNTFMKTFSSFSFGCRVNQAEKESLDRALVAKGYINRENGADLYILNTCSVTHKAEREAKQHIYQIRRSYPKTKIVVTGCAATNWQKTGEKVQEIDYLVDNQSKEYIAELIDKKFRLLKQPKQSINSNKTVRNDKFVRSGRIILKIQDGCQRFCSFCIVPYLRGMPKSKSIDSILKLIHENQEFNEVILTAINTQAFGYDTNEKFTNLVKRVLEETEVKRLSFGSIHPWSIDEEFLNLYGKYASSKRFVHFFHIPLQSGSNKTLNLMKRGYTREEFIDKLNMINTLNRMAFIGTDVIVGFLEETDRDFEDTYDFLKKTPISKFHVFRFSKREHTAAYHLSKRLKSPSPAEAQARSAKLRELSQEKYQKFLEKHINLKFEGMFLEKRINDHQLVLLNNQIPAYIATEKDMTGQLKSVKISELNNGILFGRVV